MQKKINNWLIGADPELFIVNEKTGKIVSSIGLIPGVKGDAFIPEGFDKGYGIQIDNILGEFNIPPTNDINSFTESIELMKKWFDDFVKSKNPDLGILCQASAMVDSDQLQSEEAQQFGCMPDYNAWTEEMNTKPEGEKTNLRTTGCHFHIGYDNPTPETSVEIIRTLDIFLGVPSVVMDPDERRRELYGKAGCFRLTKYGCEYRTMSGYFISNSDLIRWCFNSIKNAINFINEGRSVEEDKEGIIQAINNNDKEKAEELIKKYFKFISKM